jgi:osmotically-inducible protein OsmY
MTISNKIFIVLALFFATSCVETVVVASVTGGVLVTREKTVANTGDDIVIAARLNKELVANGLKNFGNTVDTTVNEGRVLLTGILRDTHESKTAVNLAWKVPNVKEVIDEIQVRDDEKMYAKDFSRSVSDYAITGEVNAKLLFARKVTSVNYKITTVGKTVYLLGVAEDTAELQRVLNIVAKVRGVEKVVNHVILADDHRRK